MLYPSIPIYRVSKPTRASVIRIQPSRMDFNSEETEVLSNRREIVFLKHVYNLDIFAEKTLCRIMSVF